MKHALMIFAALALSACVSHDFSAGERTYYRCDAGKTLNYRRVGDAIEVFAAGTTHRLEPAADGYSSADGAISFTQAGGRATLTGVYEGPYQNCRRQTRLSRFF